MKLHTPGLVAALFAMAASAVSPANAFTSGSRRLMRQAPVARKVSETDIETQDAARAKRARRAERDARNAKRGAFQ